MADLPVKAVEVSGRDNQTFRLGEDMSARLPSAEGCPTSGKRTSMADEAHVAPPASNPCVPGEGRSSGGIPLTLIRLPADRR
jgi:hypothetical protein